MKRRRGGETANSVSLKDSLALSQGGWHRKVPATILCMEGTMLLSVGIFTAPRAPYYLGDSLDSYFRSWDIIPHVWAEPDTPTNFLHHDKVIWHLNTMQYGCAFNWFNSLKRLRATHDSAYYLMCEDDISWLSGSSEALRSVLLNQHVDTQHGRLRMDEIAFISPYCSLRNTFELGPRDQWMVPRLSSGWCGALSICLSAKNVDSILSRGDEFAWYCCERTNNHRILHLDYAIGKMFPSKYIVTHNPTLVLHLGEISTFETNNRDTSRHSSSRLPAL